MSPLAIGSLERQTGLLLTTGQLVPDLSDYKSLYDVFCDMVAHATNCGTDDASAGSTDAEYTNPLPTPLSEGQQVTSLPIQQGHNVL